MTNTYQTTDLRSPASRAQRSVAAVIAQYIQDLSQARRLEIRR